MNFRFKIYFENIETDENKLNMCFGDILSIIKIISDFYNLSFAKFKLPCYVLLIRYLSRGIHNPRGQLRGRGGRLSQMTILLHKPHLVKVTMNEGRAKYPKIWPRGLWMAPIINYFLIPKIPLIPFLDKNSAYWGTASTFKSLWKKYNQNK